ncbi:DUF4158 domain-containing protein [Nonomuraea wenchangensis]|uniref:DUF4158 domain-containing protein n=1 Tax=Nonomuraea wenchangensis TaxID=568860 RepID=A0A1I0LQ49_9ACTN|nr:hypothetical protein [Nonomuraea wenchangensis]SEU43940.1 hypothetical protein SAMN05421811_122103 [Nonomuraea wenchangensis]
MAPAVLRLYGGRDQTRSDHLGLIAKYLEWQTAPAGSQAMAREYLLAAKVIQLLRRRQRGWGKRNWPNSTPQYGAP